MVTIVNRVAYVAFAVHAELASVARANVVVPFAPGVTDVAVNDAVAASFGVEKAGAPNAAAEKVNVQRAVLVPANAVSGVAGCGLL